MSRSKNKSKSTGAEYWSKRPNKGTVPSTKNKKITHKMERQQGKKESKQYE